MKSLRLVLILAVLGPTTPALAAEDTWSELDRIGEARVTDIIDGDTVVIDPPLDGMAEVRLVGIQAPKLPLGRKGFKAWPLAKEARQALVDLVNGRSVELFAGGARADRHDRHLAHLRTADGAWVQGSLLRHGWARVYSFADNRALVTEMLGLEEQARREHAGIWGHPNYFVRKPSDLVDLIDRFEVIEGRIVSVAIHNGSAYLNFADDWRTDFTLVVRPSSMQPFRDAGIDFERYEERTIRARGWLKSFNGPMIEVTHPEQIEILP